MDFQETFAGLLGVRFGGFGVFFFIWGFRIFRGFGF